MYVQLWWKRIQNNLSKKNNNYTIVVNGNKKTLKVKILKHIFTVMDGMLYFSIFFVMSAIKVM